MQLGLRQARVERGIFQDPRSRQWEHLRTRADHLIFIEFDFKNLRGEIVFNGPECIPLQDMPESWSGQRPVSNRKMRRLNDQVLPHDRLTLVDASPTGDIPDQRSAAAKTLENAFIQTDF